MTPPSATPRAVVDTNLIVSGVILARGNPHALLAAWREGAFHLIFSTKQYVELVDVLSCPKLVERYGLEADELAALFDGLSAIPRIESIAPLPLIVRDPKDEFLLATALAADATHLVSGDNDLLVLKGDPRLGALQIVTVIEFLAVLARRSQQYRQE